MKVFFRVLIVGTCLAIVWYYTNFDEQSSVLLHDSIQQEEVLSLHQRAISQASALTRPKIGLSIFVGKGEKDILYNFGTPTYIEATPYHYEWWIYEQQGVMVGIKDSVVNQIYTNAVTYNISPYEMNQTLEDIYRRTILEEEIAVAVADHVYLLMMDEVDIQSRILVKYEDLYAQLYMDTVTNTLAGIRFLDGETLVLHQSYPMQSAEQREDFVQPIDLLQTKQMVVLINSIRVKNGYEPLAEEWILNEATAFNLQRQNGVATKLAEEQRTEKTHYADAVEAVQSWMNADVCREQLFSEAPVDVSVLANYYTLK